MHSGTSHIYFNIYISERERYVFLQTCNTRRALSPNHLNSAGSGFIRESQAKLESLSILPSTSLGQDFTSQFQTKICMLEIHYMLALGTFSLHLGGGRGCGGG